MRVRWAHRARQDRRDLISFVEDESPLAALELDERIDHAVLRLADYPLSGRVGRASNTRELVIQHTPYIAVYAVDDSGVRIIRLIHGARQWPPAGAI
ncbi:type II toxin-antitoxin system RelE/ParE family toxin [Devosia sp.]|uniref:type II toxin-antitoxin system RelE/ParE family toxin n=1 Tax=Devosia sp. TaxID=1871048 RepID=UPI0035AFA4DC